MKEPIIIVWGFLAILAGIWLRWGLKRNQRSVGSSVSIQILIFVLLSSMAGLVFQLTMSESLHSVWATRLVLLVFGIANVWAIYRQEWSKRDKYSYTKDSFAPEVAFTATLGMVCSIGFVLSPRMLGYFGSYLNIPKKIPDFTMWDAPLLFLLPILAFKMADMAGQVPFRYVERIWFYPRELVSAEKMPWRELIRVNFIVANTLLDEYRIFGRRSHPWIEIPKEATLEKVFRLMVQERRKKQGLAVIQDLGNEYGGDPQFWWLFKIKFVWWKPSTWRRKPMFLNPDLSVGVNKIRGNDIIYAWRVPADKEMLPENQPWTGQVDNDPEKTVILNR